MSNEEHIGTLRKHLLELLQDEPAHVSFKRATADLPAALRGAKPPGQPHTPWRLVEHMRIAQLDILEFSRDGRHKSPPWPDGYWPADDAPASAKEWQSALRDFGSDRQAMIDLISQPDVDLLAPIPHAPKKQTLAREAMLLADHTAYHVGQLILLRRLLGAWKDE
jgi:hypothetical protein